MKLNKDEIYKVLLSSGLEYKENGTNTMLLLLQSKDIVSKNKDRYGEYEVNRPLFNEFLEDLGSDEYNDIKTPESEIDYE